MVARLTGQGGVKRSKIAIPKSIPIICCIDRRRVTKATVLPSDLAHVAAPFSHHLQKLYFTLSLQSVCYQLDNALSMLKYREIKTIKPGFGLHDPFQTSVSSRWCPGAKPAEQICLIFQLPPISFCLVVTQINCNQSSFKFQNKGFTYNFQQYFKYKSFRENIQFVIL